jgi:phosphoribosylaminoimidazole-succinocarboxamide synthase
MPPEVQKYANVLEGRAMLVRRAKVIPIEAIVRGYITGAYEILEFDAQIVLCFNF